MSNLPSGEIPRGAIRFNTDSNRLELWDGSQWAELQLSTPNLGQGSDTQPGARGIFAGGYLNPGTSDTIDYINISSTGDAVDFGDLTGSGRRTGGSGSSQTRALFMGGYVSSGLASIDTLTIASTGDATDYGDLDLGARWNAAGASNATRALYMGGETPSPNTYVNEIEYMAIASTGAGRDFGNLTDTVRPGGQGGAASPTRAIVAQGRNPSNEKNNIDFITIATLGDAQDFGDLTVARTRIATCSNATRGLFGGGVDFPGTNFTTTDYVTIASAGNAVLFGDLTLTGRRGGACASPIRGVWGGGSPTGSPVSDVIDYVQIMTLGDAVDFGDLSVSRSQMYSASNAHGGL